MSWERGDHSPFHELELLIENPGMVLDSPPASPTATQLTAQLLQPPMMHSGAFSSQFAAPSGDAYGVAPPMNHHGLDGAGASLPANSFPSTQPVGVAPNPGMVPMNQNSNWGMGPIVPNQHFVYGNNQLLPSSSSQAHPMQPVFAVWRPRRFKEGDIPMTEAEWGFIGLGKGTERALGSDVSGYYCPLCYFSCKTQRGLTRHMEVHPGTCKHCRETFASQRDWKKHCYNKTWKPHHCKKCGKRFRCTWFLKNHKCPVDQGLF